MNPEWAWITITFMVCLTAMIITSMICAEKAEWRKLAARSAQVDAMRQNAELS